MKTVPEPPAYFSKKHRIIWLQKYACSKIWRQCITCRKWRLIDAKTAGVLTNWTCQSYSITCDDTSLEFENCRPDGLEFNVGDLVTAHVYGYPWWPAVVDFDPFTETYFSGGPNSVEAYHVVFIDTRERAWVTAKDVKSYRPPLRINTWKFKNELLKADQEARKALKMKPFQRLLRYSYVMNMKDIDPCELNVTVNEVANSTF